MSSTSSTLSSLSFIAPPDLFSVHLQLNNNSALAVPLLAKILAHAVQQIDAHAFIQKVTSACKRPCATIQGVRMFEVVRHIAKISIGLIYHLSGNIEGVRTKGYENTITHIHNSTAHEHLVIGHTGKQDIVTQISCNNVPPLAK